MSGPLLSVVVPVRDDAARLDFALTRLAELCRDRGSHAVPIEVLVVDDGSRDRTAEVARRHTASFERYQLTVLPWPCGRGMAVRNGIAQAAGQNVVLIDVRAPLEIASLPLLEGMLEYADVVVGRDTDPAGDGRPARGRWTDTAQSLGRRLGCSPRTQVRAMRTDTAKLLCALIGTPGPHFGAQMSEVALSMGLRVLEMPVFWRRRPGRIRGIDTRTSPAWGRPRSPQWRRPFDRLRGSTGSAVRGALRPVTASGAGTRPTDPAAARLSPSREAAG